MAKKNFRNSILEKAKKIRIDEEMKGEAESLSEGEKYILERKRQRGEPEPTLGEMLLQERFSSPPKVEQPEPIVEEIEVEQPQPIVEQIEEDPQVEPDWSGNPFAKVQEEVNEQDDEDRISWYLEKVRDERVQVKGDILEQDLQNTPATMEQLANLRGVVTRLQTSLTSLGGGGIGYQEVKHMIEDGAYNIDSADLTALEEKMELLIDSAIGTIEQPTTDDVIEASNLYYTTARSDSDFDVRFDTKTTDDLAEGQTKKYYSNQRIDNRVDTILDSDFLDARMGINNLGDVQINYPTLNATDVLQWNGSVWTNSNLGIASTVDFRGSIDATADSAPSASNGDLYLNTGSGAAGASWVGLTTVDSGDAIVYDEDDTSWRNVGQINTSSVVRVQPGTGIEVDETDPSQPTVSINRTTTDSWYYTQSQVDSDLDTYLPLAGGTVTGSVTVEGGVTSNTISSGLAQDLEFQKSGSPGLILRSSVTEFTNRPARYNYLAAQSAGTNQYDLIHKAYLENYVDSEHAWNVAEHAALDSDKVSKSGDAMSGTLAFNGAHQTIMTIDPDSAQHIDLFNDNPSASDVTVRLTGGSSGNSLKIRGTESEFIPFGNLVYKRSTDTVGAGDIQADLGGSRSPIEITQWKLSFTSRPDGDPINTPTIGTIIRLYKGGQYADYGVTSVTVDGQFWVMGVNHIQTVGVGMTFFTLDTLSIETKDSSTLNVDMVSFNADASIDYNVNISMNSHRITDVADAVDPYDAINKSMLDSDISTKVSKSGDTMTGDLTLTNPYRLSANVIGGVGNSNLSIKRWNDTKIQITSTANKNFQKIKYSADYGVDSDLDVPHKKYVDSAIDAKFDFSNYPELT